MLNMTANCFGCKFLTTFLSLLARKIDFYGASFFFFFYSTMKINCNMFDDQPYSHLSSLRSFTFSSIFFDTPMESETERKAKRNSTVLLNWLQKMLYILCHQNRTHTNKIPEISISLKIGCNATMFIK